jgi:Rrf2 family protein
MTKKTGYGLIAMTHLAKLPMGRLASAREIAERYSIPPSLLMNVLKELSSAGYVQSVRGVHGGYRIARPPRDVNFIGLVEVLEGPMKLAECITGSAGDGQDGGTCELMGKCPIADPIHRAHRRIRDFLKQMTLADVMARSDETAKK